MKQSLLFTKTSKDAPKDEPSLNAQLLIRAGFVDKLMAGVYSYLPLGLRVLDKIKNIVREEMEVIDGQEILMPALSPKENWEKTGRWDGLDVLFKLNGVGDKDYALGATHEEVVTPLVNKHVFSYKDLPMAVYQIQDKFRNELRAKSGLLRGREFSMKDLYSFHATEEDLNEYYEKSKVAYDKIFSRCGLDAKLVEADGGTFSKFSHEFQVFTESGEDDVYGCEKCDIYKNKEIVKSDKCECGTKWKINKAIEVGNIFPLKTKYSDAFNFKFVDESGKEQTVLMGCYGIGPSRVMGSIVEVYNDEKGMIWPDEVAPYAVHLISLGKDSKIAKAADKLYEELSEAGVEVLYDDRDESAGAKLNDSDLIGLPLRILISEKTLAKNEVEFKARNNSDVIMVDLKKVIKTVVK
jgi:prolyl-tRNA synthetase